MNIVVYIERVLCVTFLRPSIYRHKQGMVKARKLEVRSKIFLFSKMMQVYGNRSADICPVMQVVGQAVHYLSMCALRSLCVWVKNLFDVSKIIYKCLSISRFFIIKARSIFEASSFNEIKNNCGEKILDVREKN